MSRDENDLKDKNKRQAFRTVLVDPLKKIVEEVKNASGDSNDKPVRSYQNAEVARLLQISNIYDFDHELIAQWENVRSIYRKEYPNNLKDLEFFLETDFCESEIEAGKHRFGEKILAQFSEDELREINNFYSSEAGKIFLKLAEILRIELRNERLLISKKISSRLESAVANIKNKN